MAGGFIGKGDLYFTKETLDDYYKVGNVTKFAISETEADVKERISRQKDTYGQALDRVTIKKPPKISITIDDFDKDNLAIALRGIVVESSDSGTVTDEEHTAKINALMKLNHNSVSDVVVKSSDGTTTYVEGSDYKVKTGIGMIQVVEGGAITDGSQIKVSYSYNEQYAKILGSQMADVAGTLVFNGVNQGDNKEYNVYIYKARLMSTKEVNLISEDFETLELEGTLLTPDDKNEPYIVTIAK